MRRPVVIGLLLFTLHGFSQKESIKVRKPVSQASMESTVTLCGKYQGGISRDSLIRDHQLRIWNNKAGFKIISFELSFNSVGMLYNYNCTNDTIPREALLRLGALNKRTNLSVENIKAVVKADTVFLNPIILRLD